MVIAGVVIAEEDEQKLVDLKVKDSKLLTPMQRSVLFDLIKKTVKNYKFVIVEPQEIDAALSSDDLNLNWLEAGKMAEIINELKPGRAYLDCPSTNTRAFTAYLKKLLKSNVEIIAEHKADVHYPIVSAASILAKVLRDREIEKIKEKIGIDFGSGYPADPKTQKFLEKHCRKYPQICRTKWVSYQRAAGITGQKKLREY